MKKKLLKITICLILTIFNIVFCSIPVKGTADENISFDIENELYINELIEKYSVNTSISEVESSVIYNPLNYLSAKHQSQQKEWNIKNLSETSNIIGSIPIEMKSNDFPMKPIEDALEELDLSSTYGGCGPIVTMGIVEYFANTFIYSKLPNAKTYDSQLEIAKLILKHTNTYEVEGGTLTLPWDIIYGFEKTMEKYGFENTIIATDHGMINSKETKVQKIKEQIDKGLPVTIYTLGAGTGDLANHYFNVYGYETYYTIDSEGNYISETLLKIRPNYNKTIICYADSILLSSTLTGVIYYDIVYNEKVLTSSNFATFVNSNNQGEYFNNVVEQRIIVNEEFGFNTNRLRCSYIENEYLVLSAIMKNGVYVENEFQEAYLEMDFRNYDNINKLELDLSVWSTAEAFDTESIFKIEYKRINSQEWYTDEKHTIVVDYTSMLPTKESSKRFIFYFPYDDVNRIRIYLTNPKVDSTRNKGRVVINGINLCFDNHNKPVHYHRYHNDYTGYDSLYHRAYCDCGEFELQSHIKYTDEFDNVKCSICQYMIQEHVHIANEDVLPHSSYECFVCGEYKVFGHLYENDYNMIDSDIHEFFCVCGESITEEHNYNIVELNDSVGHKTSCICGAYLVQPHVGSTDSFGNIKCSVCQYLIYEHIHTSNTEIQAHIVYECQVCGENINPEHIYNCNYSSVDSINHFVYCECRESIIEEHLYELVGSYDSIVHTLYCKCGESKVETHCYKNGVCIYCEYVHNHSYTYYPRGDGVFHSAICGCSFSKNESCKVMATIFEDTYCSKCGQLIGFQPIV